MTNDALQEKETPQQEFDRLRAEKANRQEARAASYRASEAYTRHAATLVPRAEAKRARKAARRVTAA